MKESLVAYCRPAITVITKGLEQEKNPLWKKKNIFFSLILWNGREGPLALTVFEILVAVYANELNSELQEKKEKKERKRAVYAQVLSHQHAPI